MRVALRSSTVRPGPTRVGRPQLLPFRPVCPVVTVVPCQFTAEARRMQSALHAAVAEAPEAPAVEQPAKPSTTGKPRRVRRAGRGRKGARRQPRTEGPVERHPHLEAIKFGALVTGSVVAVNGNRTLSVEVDGVVDEAGNVAPLPALPEGRTPLRLPLPISRISGVPMLALGDAFKEGERLVAVVRQERRRLGRGGRAVPRRVLSTLELEREPGSLLANRTAVMEAAVETMAMRASGQLAAARPADDGTPVPQRGALLRGEVLSVDVNGATVSLPELPGWTGLLRRGGLTAVRVTDATSLLAAGQGVEAVAGKVIGGQRVVLLDRRPLELVPGDYYRAAVSGTPYTGAEAAHAGLQERRKDVRKTGIRVGQVVNCVVLAVAEAGDRAVLHIREAPGRRAGMDLTPGSEAPALGSELVCRVAGQTSTGEAVLKPHNGEAEAADFPDLQVGSVLSGKVVNVKSFGAFVDAGGVVGLLHRDQMSTAQPVGNVMTFLKRGEELPVVVAGVDKAKLTASFSTKELEVTPGDIKNNRDALRQRAAELTAAAAQ